MFTWAGVLRERRRGRKSGGRMGVVRCCAGVEGWDGDRVSGCEAKYVVYACRVLGCRATGTLSESLSSYKWRVFLTSI